MLKKASEYPVATVVIFTDSYDYTRLIMVKAERRWNIYDVSADIDGIKSGMWFVNSNVQEYLNCDGDDGVKIYVILPEPKNV